MPGNQPAIAASDVRKTYAHSTGDPSPALDGFNLEVPQGTVRGLLGPNGAGKTTAIRVMTTLLDFDSGSMRVAGFDVARHGRQVRRRIGLVGQYAAIDEELSGRQNLVMFGRLSRLSPAGARRHADELLERFGLGDTRAKRASDYSGGMRRRLDLAAALLVAPKILFVDEPTTGLDPAGRRDVWDAIRGLVDGGTTVLLTTQYLEEADQLADHISMMAHGWVVAEGTPADLKARVGDDWLEITAGSTVDADRIADLVGSWANGEVHVVDRCVQVPVVDRASALLGVSADLHDAGLRPIDVGLRTPTLDEVFLHLTGAPARSDPGSPDDRGLAAPETSQIGHKDDNLSTINGGVA